MAQSSKTLYEQLRKDVGSDIDSASAHIWRYSAVTSWIILSVTIVTSSFLFVLVRLVESPSDELSKWRIGDAWNDGDLKTNVAFSVLRDDSEIENELARVRKSSPLFFTRSIRDEYRSRTSKTLRKSLESGLKSKMEREEANRLIRAFFATAAETIRSRPIVNTPISESSAKRIIVEENNLEVQFIESREVLDSSDILSITNSLLERTEFMELSKFRTTLLDELYIPSLKLNRAKSRHALQVAEQSVLRTLGFIRAGEIIVRRGAKIDSTVFQRLKSYATLVQKTADREVSPLSVGGTFGHSTLLVGMLFIFLYFYRPAIFGDAYQLGTISAALLFVLVQGIVFSLASASFPIQFGVVIPAVALLLAVLFDSRTSFYSTVSMSLLMAALFDNDYSLGLSMMIAGAMGSYSVRDLQTRPQMFRSILFIAVGFALSITITHFEYSEDVGGLLQKLGVAALNSTLSPLIAFALLMIIERSLDVTTSQRLLEFDNLQHPLLLQMREKAPGTYQHTLVVSQLADVCAREVGANALLARVGAYFHDVGKIPKADYFMENQVEGINKHDFLTPQKSVSIIKSHVEDGIELAKTYKLPRRVIDFIPMHHGTSLIKHFYAKAIESSTTTDPIDQNSFRYSGPKPNTKETAIVMIVDALEAITRSVESDNKLNIDELVKTSIRERIDDGQFSETDLSLSEIQTIIETVTKSIEGLRHQRTPYKTILKDEV